MFFLYFLHTTFARTVKRQNGPVAPDTNPDCTFGDEASASHNCKYLETTWGITHAELVAWVNGSSYPIATSLTGFRIHRLRTTAAALRSTTRTVLKLPASRSPRVRLRNHQTHRLQHHQPHQLRHRQPNQLWLNHHRRRMV